MIDFDTDHRIVILPYKRYSRGAKTLQEELKIAKANYTSSMVGLLRVNRDTASGWGMRRSGVADTQRFYQNITYVNWGDSSLVGSGIGGFWDSNNCRVLNSEIGKYSDKKKFFQTLVGKDYIPKFFTNSLSASEWLNSTPGAKLCVRMKTQASGGEGLSIISSGETVPLAPLYVEYKKKKHEFRYHFFKGAGGFLQQKRLRHGTESKNFEIRNHENNWVFCREAVDDIPAVTDLCTTLKHIATSEWGLHFGAFDLIYNQSENKAYVLEINTAPGLEGQTAKDYAKYFMEYHLKNTAGFVL